MTRPRFILKPAVTRKDLLRHTESDPNAAEEFLRFLESIPAGEPGPAEYRMSGLVVDTDVVSLVFKRHPLSEPYLDLLQDRQLVVSFMTIAELYLWSLRSRWGDRKRAMLDRYVDGFSVCFCDEGLCEIWAEIRDESYRRGQPVDGADAWIAATGLYLGFPVVTNNRRHFANIHGLQVLSSPGL